MTLCIAIYTEDIVPDTQFMKDKSGRLDLLGQILLIGHNVHINSRCELPADQNTLVHPFTVCYRQKAYNTPLTLALLHNASLPGIQQLELANALLDEYDILLEKA